jgi:hypothetical protein
MGPLGLIRIVVTAVCWMIFALDVCGLDFAQPVTCSLHLSQYGNGPYVLQNANAYITLMKAHRPGGLASAPPLNRMRVGVANLGLIPSTIPNLPDPPGAPYIHTIE